MNAKKLLEFNEVILADLKLACEALPKFIHSPELVDRIVEPCMKLTRSDRGTFFLATRDGYAYDKNYLTSKYATGLNGNVIQIASTSGIAGAVFTNDQPIIINDTSMDARISKRVSNETGYKPMSILCVPIRSTIGKNFGVLQMLSTEKNNYSEVDLSILQIMSAFAGLAFEQSDTLYSLGEVKEKLQGKSLVNRAIPTSQNRSLQEFYDRLPMFAKTDSSILIEGESGTGKEVIAHLLHSESDRHNRPFVAVNCAAIPESLFEAELFGVAKGAATGTLPRMGKFEAADGGTLFLDEIGEMPLSMQAKLLRVLQEREVARVGYEGQPQKVDFRVLSATNRDLAELVRAGKFREDLFYRINVVRFRLPPLRERKEDLPALCELLISDLSHTRNLRSKSISPDALEALSKYQWPGNIRQLQNKLEHALITSGSAPALRATDFLFDEKLNDSSNLDPLQILGIPQNNLQRAREIIENEVIKRSLQQVKGNKTRAAKLLGLSREGLRLLLKKVSRNE